VSCVECMCRAYNKILAAFYYFFCLKWIVGVFIITDAFSVLVVGMSFSMLFVRSFSNFQICVLLVCAVMSFIDAADVMCRHCCRTLGELLTIGEHGFNWSKLDLSSVTKQEFIQMQFLTGRLIYACICIMKLLDSLAATVLAPFFNVHLMLC